MFAVKAGEMGIRSLTWNSDQGECVEGGTRVSDKVFLNGIVHYGKKGPPEYISGDSKNTRRILSIS